VLGERHPPGSEWRWGFNWYPAGPDDQGGPRRAWVGAEEGVDLTDALATARARAERAQELQDRVLAEAQQAWVGRRLEVLVERVEGDGAVEGRSFREAPDADGVVRVDGASLTVGEYLPVVVTAAQGPELLARPAG
jgi:tRNA A37 methylthiotransferase MiaB